MVEVKFNGKHLREFIQLKYHLKDIFLDAMLVWPSDDMYITDIWRPKTTDTGVHELYRGIDVGIQNISGDYQHKAEVVAEHLNSIWLYDPDRLYLCVAVAKPHGTGPHMHLQSHPHTVKRYV